MHTFLRTKKIWCLSVFKNVYVHNSKTPPSPLYTFRTLLANPPPPWRVYVFYGWTLLSLPNINTSFFFGIWIFMEYLQGETIEFFIHFSGTPCQVCLTNIPLRLGKQGYKCRDCSLICHKPCHVRVDTHCLETSMPQMELWV